MYWLFGKKKKKEQEKSKVNVAEVKEKLDKQIEFTGMNANKYETQKHLERKQARIRLCLFAFVNFQKRRQGIRWSGWSCWRGRRGCVGWSSWSSRSNWIMAAAGSTPGTIYFYLLIN